MKPRRHFTDDQLDDIREEFLQRAAQSPKTTKESRRIANNAKYNRQFTRGELETIAEYFRDRILDDESEVDPEIWQLVLVCDHLTKESNTDDDDHHLVLLTFQTLTRHDPDDTVLHEAALNTHCVSHTKHSHNVLDPNDDESPSECDICDCRACSSERLKYIIDIALDSIDR